MTTLIRIEPRAWSRDAQGNLVQGCFRSGGIYLPAETTPQKEDGWSRAATIFTVVSLVVGTGATIATWGK